MPQAGVPREYASQSPTGRSLHVGYVVSHAVAALVVVGALVILTDLVVRPTLWIVPGEWTSFVAPGHVLAFGETTLLHVLTATGAWVVVPLWLGFLRQRCADVG